MKITLVPQRRDDALVLEKSSDDRLSINGELFDFESLNDGDEVEWQDLPAGWFAGPVQRIDGEINVSLFLPCVKAGWEVLNSPHTIIVEHEGPVDVPEETTHVDA